MCLCPEQKAERIIKEKKGLKKKEKEINGSVSISQLIYAKKRKNALKIRFQQTHPQTYWEYVLSVSLVLPQKRILKSHYGPSPTPPTNFRWSNSHSQDSWCGNGSVKPQISLFNDSLPVSAAHYCHHFRASARGITSPDCLREEDYGDVWQSFCLPCTLPCNISIPPLVYLPFSLALESIIVLVSRKKWAEILFRYILSCQVD